jgi:uncharacterized membrane protein YqiK
MIMAKKAQGISLTTVVIAAVALIVLVVLILIFSGRLSLVQRGVAECPEFTEGKVENQLGPSGMCLNGKLPVKVVEKGGVVTYCCPK